MARRISDIGLLAIAVVRMLSTDAGIPVARAVALVRAAATDTGIGSLHTESGLRIELPRTLAADLPERLRDAMQAAPRRARGRPPLHR